MKIKIRVHVRAVKLNKLKMRKVTKSEIFPKFWSMRFAVHFELFE